MKRRKENWLVNGASKLSNTTESHFFLPKNISIPKNRDDDNLINRNILRKIEIVKNICSINRTYVRKIENYLSEEIHKKNMLEHILDSKVKTKIVKLFAERNEAFHVSAVARALKISKSRASECLRELAEKGVLESQVIGRSKIYKPASTNFAKTVYRSVTQEKTLLEEIEKDVLKELKKFKVVSLVLFGSALRELKIGSDVDFLLLYEGMVDKDRIYEICAELTEKFGFHISILTMEVKEFKAKARRGEEFILNVMANHKLLYGKNLEKVVWQER